MPTPLTQFLPAGDRVLEAGDREAFAALYDRLGARLYRTALTMLASTPEAEDLVHDLFVDLARNRQKLAGVADLDGYIFAMLRHAVGRRHRRESLARRSIDRLGQERLDAGGFTSQPAEIEDEALAAAVASLPIAQRTPADPPAALRRRILEMVPATLSRQSAQAGALPSPYLVTGTIFILLLLPLVVMAFGTPRLDRSSPPQRMLSFVERARLAGITIETTPTPARDPGPPVPLTARGPRVIDAHTLLERTLLQGDL